MIKRYLQMILFVVILGSVSAGILIGMDLLTRDRIAANAEYSWKSAILTHNNIAYDTNNFATVFDANITPEDMIDPETDTPLTLYRDNTTGNISFKFSGYGLWDVIEGVITLEDDFTTIVYITVLKQAETPGLGGIVAERPYLEKFIGKKFDALTGLTWVKTEPATDSEVDAITGATGTTSAFIGIINTTYQQYYNNFFGFEITDQHKQTMLDHVGIDWNETNFNDLFEAEFEVVESGRLALYIGRTTKTFSFRFSVGGAFGAIESLLTLEEDRETIVNLSVLSSSEVWGMEIESRSYLDQFIGKKFDPEILFVGAGEADLDNEVEEITNAGATTTRTQYPLGLNGAYTEYYNAFLATILTTDHMKAMLDHVGVIWTEENFETLFDSQFTVETIGLKNLYVHDSTSTYSYIFGVQGAFGLISTVITLEDDYQTIVNISVVEHREQWGASVASRTFLDQFIGKRFNPEIVFVGVGEADQDNEIENTISAGATTTRTAFPESLNENYAAYFEAYGWGE